MATAFDSLSLPEAVGAYLVVGFLIIVLGLTGFVSHLTRLCPLPIVFGMVAGVFLPISVNVVTGFSQQPVVSLVTVAGFVIVSAMPRYGRVLPPVLASLLFGGIVIGLTGRFSPTVIPPGIFALPVVVKPDFNWIGVAELAAPLVISVVVIQNMQGFAILRSVGHKPPVNAMTLMCGLGSIPMAFLGSVPTCVTGPAAGIIVGSAPVKRHFASAIVFGIILIVFGLAAPAMTWLAAGLPPTFIATVGGLALLPVLQQAFRATFSGPLALGGLVAFLVTVAGQPILNIGAPFWGLFFGILVAWLLEYKEMRAAISPTQGVSAS
jgi:benzoate membrane transport protein